MVASGLAANWILWVTIWFGMTIIALTQQVLSPKCIRTGTGRFDAARARLLTVTALLVRFVAQCIGIPFIHSNLLKFIFMHMCMGMSACTFIILIIASYHTFAHMIDVKEYIALDSAAMASPIIYFY